MAPSCAVRGSLAVVLRLMQLCGLAPVSMKRETRGLYRIKLCGFYPIISSLVITVLNMIHAIYIRDEIKIKLKVNLLSDGLPLVTLLWVMDLFLVTIIASVNSYTCKAQITYFIDIMTLLSKANVGYKIKDVENKTSKAIIVIIVTKIILDAPQLLMWTDATRVKNAMTCLVAAYILAIYDVVLSKLRLVREELQNITEALEIGNASQIDINELTNVRLQAVYETLNYIKELFMKINKFFEYKIFFIFIYFVVRLIRASYNVMEFTALGLSLYCLRQICYVLHYTFCIIIFVETFRKLQMQIMDMKVLVGRISITNCVPNKIPTPLKNMYSELITSDFSFSPLGVFTFRRSLISKGIGAVISYIVLVLQFKVK